MEVKEALKKNKTKIVFIIFFSLLFAFFGTQIITNDINSFNELFSVSFTGLFFDRFILIFIFFLFIGLHWIVPIKTLYNWIFNKRYWIALIVLIFMTVNQYHGSSIGCFNQHIQPGQGSEYVNPVFGMPRGIRSDEWLVSTPNRLTAQYGEEPYSRYNQVMRGTQTPNMISSANMYKSYASLVNPFTFAIYLFGQDYGQSIMWYGQLLLTFLISIEMCMIITKKNKLLSTMGAVLIVFSGYNQWWSFVAWILGAQSCIVCGYYFIQQESKIKKFLLAIGLGLSLAYFVGLLYPAWQVPVGYLFLGILVWIIYENIEKIKKLDKVDWLFLIGSFIFAASIVLSYLYANQEYTESIMNTVYPGHRISTGGEKGYFNKVFWWFYNPLFIVPGKAFINPSEAGSIMTFFPIPLLMAVWYTVKEKKKDFLTIVLIIFSLFIGSYIFLGWPEILAKITLMSYSVEVRAVDVLMFAQVYILLAVLSRFEKPKQLSPIAASAVIGICLPIYVIINLIKFPEVGIPSKYIVLMGAFFAICCFFIMVKLSNRTKKIVVILITLCGLFTGIFVHPIQKGFDAIYSKPLAQEVKSIVSEDKEEKWLSIAEGIVPQQFLIACGAPTINSVNVMPNMELWNKLDLGKKYEDIYNRYAHIAVTLTEENTSFELVGTDYMKINLAYKDLFRTGVKYIYSNTEINDNQYVTFEKIYEEGNNYIYEVNYLSSSV